MNRLNKVRTHFGRHAPSVAHPISEEMVGGWLQSAEKRPTGNVPTIYDLVAICESLQGRYPLQSRAALAKLRWLMKVANKKQEGSWDHPWL